MTKPTCKTCRWSKPMSGLGLEAACMNPINDRLVYGESRDTYLTRAVRIVKTDKDFCGEHTPKDHSND